MYVFGISALKNVVFTGIFGDFENFRNSTSVYMYIYRAFGKRMFPRNNVISGIMIRKLFVADVRI